MIKVNGKTVTNGQETEVLWAYGFDEAIVGIGTQAGMDLVIYDFGKCIKILMTRDKMTEEQAEEFMQFNVTSAHAGKAMPVFMWATADDLVEQNGEWVN